MHVKTNPNLKEEKAQMDIVRRRKFGQKYKGLNALRFELEDSLLPSRDSFISDSMQRPTSNASKHLRNPLISIRTAPTDQ